MFGISGAEFLVIILVAIVVLPPRMWPDVAQFLARAVKFVRQIIWKITDASEQIKDTIEREAPIDRVIMTTTDDILAEFATPIKQLRGKTKTKSRRGTKKCKK